MSKTNHPSISIPVLAGPTAAGKSSLALELAQKLNLEIISADAMLVYKDMNIGTAKPTLKQQQQVKHHLINVVTPDNTFNVANYVELAEKAIAEVLAKDKIPLIVGGSGFYIRALSQGLPTVPTVDKKVQNILWQRFRQEGLTPLEQELQTFSPKDAERAQSNPRRIIRALEIIKRTGKAPCNFPFTKPAFSYQKIVLNLELAVLNKRIKERTEAMFKEGLLAEVTNLLTNYPQRPAAMQAIGYKETVAYLDGEQDLTATKEAINLATLQYAKRQRTWFRKEPNAQVLDKATDIVAEISSTVGEC